MGPERYESLHTLDLNRGNICFVHPHTLGSLHISYFGYRQLRSKHSEHIAAIFPDDKIPEMKIGIALELKGTLRLEHEEKIRVERAVVKVDRIKFFGLPTFKVATQLDLIPIRNQVS